MKPTIFKGHTRPLKYISFSVDYTKVFSGGTDRSIICWNIEKQDKEQTFQHTAAINCFVLSNCGKYLISGDNIGTVYIWNIEKVEVIKCIEGDPLEIVKSIHLNKRNSYLLIAFAGRGKKSPSRIKCFDFDKLVEPLEVEKIDSPTINNNINNNNKLYDLNSGLNNDQYSNSSIYNTMNNENINSNGKKKKGENNNRGNCNNKIVNHNLHSGNSNIIKNDIKVKMENFPSVYEIKSTSSKFCKIHFIFQDKYILAAKENGFIELINVSSGEVLLEKEIHKDTILDMDCSEELHYILTSSSDGYCCLINLDSFEIMYKFHPDSPTRNLNCCRLMLIDNPFINTKKLNVDDLFNETKNEVELFEDKFLKLRKNDKLPIAIFSGGQDSKQVTTTHKKEGGFEIIIHELITGMKLIDIDSHFGPVNTLGCLFDIPILASGSEDSSVMMYNIYDYIKSHEK